MTMRKGVDKVESHSPCRGQGESAKKKKPGWFDKLLDGPVSSAFETEEDLFRKRRVKKQKIHEGIKKVTTVARQGLNIYYQMREKTPISIGLGVLSAYGAMSEHMTNSNNVNAGTLLRDIGYVPVCHNISGFIRNTYKYIGLPMEIYWRSGGEPITNIEEYKLGDISIYFIEHVSHEHIEGPYAKSEEEFYAATSAVIEKKFGKYIMLDTNRDDNGWNKSLCLDSITFHEEAYVSSIDENELVIEWKTREPKPIGKGKVTVNKKAVLPFDSIKQAKVKINI